MTDSLHQCLNYSGKTQKQIDQRSSNVDCPPVVSETKIFLVDFPVRSHDKGNDVTCSAPLSYFIVGSSRSKTCV